MPRSLILVLLAFSALAVLVAHVHASTADDLWRRYRVEMIKLLRSRMPQQCNARWGWPALTEANSVLHVETNPTEAGWLNDPSAIDDFVGFVPRWEAGFVFDASSDNTVSNRYKELIFAHPDKSVAAQAFAKMRSVSSPNWEQCSAGETLESFVARTKDAANDAFSFTVEENAGSISINAPWFQHTSSFANMASIVRELQANGNVATQKQSSGTQPAALPSGAQPFLGKVPVANRGGFVAAAPTPAPAATRRGLFGRFFRRAAAVTLSDALELDEQVQEEVQVQNDGAEEALEQEALSDSTIFGRRRRRAPPPPVQVPVVIKAKKFHMLMTARGLGAVQVNAPYVDRAWIAANKSRFPAGYLNKGGKFSLLPSVVFVAMKPYVKLTLSESEFKQIQHHWNNGKAFGLAAGGVFFRNSKFRQTVLEDQANEVLGDVFSHEVLNTMRATGDLEDEAKFTVLDAQSGEVLEDSSSSSSVNGDVATFSVLSQDDASFSQNADDNASFREQADAVEHLLEDGVVESDAASTIFGRRRRRSAPPPPPPPPPKIHEKTYVAEFRSTSHMPQILAVVSQKFE